MDQLTLATVILFIINIIVSAVAGMIGASMKLGEYKNRLKNLEDTLGEDEHKGLRLTVRDTRDKVIAVEAIVKDRGPVSQNKSPISLTDRGWNLLKKSGGEKFVDDNFDELLKKVEALSPKTAYDIQEYSKQVIKSMTNDERLNPIKDFLFKDGSSMDEAIEVMGIHLRDKILKHKNWNVADIDGK